jgi:hypothetical protein
MPFAITDIPSIIMGLREKMKSSIRDNHLLIYQFLIYQSRHLNLLAELVLFSLGNDTQILTKFLKFLFAKRKKTNSYNQRL